MNEAEYFLQADVPENVWLGVTVGAVEAKSRIDLLRPLQASVRFLSCEPNEINMFSGIFDIKKDQALIKKQANYLLCYCN